MRVREKNFSQIGVRVPKSLGNLGLEPFDSAKKSPRSYKPKSFYQQRKKDRWECDKENSNERKPNYALSRKMNKLGNKISKSNSRPQVKRNFFDNAGTIVKIAHWICADIFSSNTNGNSSSFCENTNASSCEKDISHLYSMGLPISLVCLTSTRVLILTIHLAVNGFVTLSLVA